jgi:hypothetical protein
MTKLIRRSLESRQGESKPAFRQPPAAGRRYNRRALLTNGQEIFFIPIACNPLKRLDSEK